MNFNQVDQFLKMLENDRGKSGTDLAIYLDGKLVHRNINGFADREHNIPIDESTMYRMFSMTKPITCLAMLQLYEQGKFLLTDPVAQFLPEFAHMQVGHHQPTMPAQITMRQLFTMTSGLTYNLDTEPLTKLYREKPGTYTTREFVKAVAESPLQFDPGTHWLYSLAHDVLAACVEVISGQKFSDYLKEHIFDPLGMTDTYFAVPQDQLSRVCVRYHYDYENQRFVRDEGETDTNRVNIYQRSVNHESGGAGLTTTVNSYAKFANMLTNLGIGQNGNRIATERTINLMRENQLEGQQLKDFDWVQFRGYGYGLGVRTLLSRAQAGALGPVGEFGWAGAAGTYVLCDPATRLTVVYAQQATPNDEVWVHPRLRNIIYAALGY